MARDVVLRCDSEGCGGTDGVETVTVTVGRKTFEVDLCQEDRIYYLSELEKVGRKAARATKPQTRFKKTELTPAAL